ncbi:hypothetical protein Bca101_025205 [Brassica carinata]
MGFGLESIKSLSGGWGAAARSCDACKSVSAAVFCRVDSAFLCIACDTSIHSFSRHERVYLCEVCEQAPAAVTCKADAASLCAACDSDIHSANPLASRHERVPVESFFDSAVARISPSTFGVLGSSATVDLTAVPVMENADELDFCRSKLSTFTYPTQSISHSVSTSSLEYGVVPDGTTTVPFNRSTITTSTATTGEQPSSMDREARVLRYREKRKNRKFEKTIRYASRKAYAESRPRIKGRFAKRTETQNDDVFFSQVYASAGQYGVVPTF